MAPIIPFIPLIAAGIGAATTGVALANQPSTPSAPGAAQTAAEQAKASEAAAQAQATAMAKRRGMASTMLQSPLAAAGSQTQKATLG